MGQSNQYWYDGTPFRGQTSDNSAGVYWYDGQSYEDVASTAQSISSASGIASAETFGSGGTCLNVQQLSGNGIASDEVFGATGYITPGIWGSAGIASGEAFGAAATNSGILTGDIYRFTGIPSAEAFGTGGTCIPDLALVGTAGIASAEAFGSTGVVLNFGRLAGLTGIASDEAFGSGGTVAGPIGGVSGIVSAEAFGSTGAVLTNWLQGTTGIASAEAFGTDGAVGSIVGISGIASSEAFGSGGTLIYDQTLSQTAGIVSGETFGTDGFVAGPQDITGSAGIASDEAFGSGVVAQIFSTSGIASAEAFGSDGTVSAVATPLEITGSAGIASAEAFGSGGVVIHALAGFFGIPSEEAFGYTGGAVLQYAAADPTVILYWNGVAANDYLRINTLNVRTPSRGRGEASFTWYSEGGTVRPELGDRIEFYYRSNPTNSAAAPELLFSGAVESLSEKKLVKYQGATEVELQVTCNDWNQILDRRLFTYVVPAGATCLSVLQAMKAQILDAEEIGLSAGDPGLVVPEKTYDHVTCSEVLAELCEASGWDARVGYDRILYFGPNPLPTADVNAPYEISNTSQEFTEISVSKARNGSKYRNVQYMTLSGADRANKALDTLTANGLPDYTLTVALTRAPVVKVDGVEQVVCKRPLFTAGWQASWAENSAQLTFEPRTANPSIGQTITVEYPSDVADFTVISDAGEIAARAAAEGGTGRYEAKESMGGEGGDVTTMGQNILGRYGEFAAYSASIESNHWGWKAGQNIVVSITRPYMTAGTYYIEEVSHAFEYRNFRDSHWTSDFRTTLRVVKNGRQGKGFRDVLKPGGGSIGGGGGFGGGGGGFTPGGGGWGSTEWTFNETSNTAANNGGVPQRYVFSAASSQPGCTNAGLVENALLPPQIVCFPGIIREVQAYMAVHAGNRNAIFDVKLNGTSLFTSVTNKPQFAPSGSTPLYAATTFNNFRSRNIPVRRGDILSVEVLQTGSDDPDASGAEQGTDAQIIVVVV